jgi:cytochrome bd-type quinol oxidase subunit 1
MTMDAPPHSRRPPMWATRGGMTLASLSKGMFLLLAIEFVLGVALGLFVNLPSGSGVVSILTSYPLLDLHILIALFIIGISFRAMALSLREPNRVALSASALALISAVVATIAGWLFAFDGQDAHASFVMALGFLGVLLGAFVLRGTEKAL